MTEENKVDVQEAEVQTQPAPEMNNTATPASTEQKADLNISDLVALKSIIDVSTQRGAFRAGEMEAVGKTYNKLNAFLESVTKQKEGE
jgi:hypothetical protein